MGRDKVRADQAVRTARVDQADEDRDLDEDRVGPEDRVAQVDRDQDRVGQDKDHLGFRIFSRRLEAGYRPPVGQ